MRAQQLLRIDVERILHIAGRVIGRNVGAFKVVEVEFDFRTFGNGVAHADEQIFDFLADQCQRMQRRCETARPAA